LVISVKAFTAADFVLDSVIDSSFTASTKSLTAAADDFDLCSSFLAFFGSFGLSVSVALDDVLPNLFFSFSSFALSASVG